MVTSRHRIEPAAQPHEDVVDDFLRAARLDLGRTYPHHSRRRLRHIREEFGLLQFPDALLLDEGSNGPGAAFRAARELVGRARGSIRSHPLFSPAYYLAANRDVARSGVDPWVHYQVRGRLEGRSPHPLLDIASLRRSIVGVLPGQALDHYISRRQYWLTIPGPYVDVESFVLTGPWDGESNPLLQILRAYPVDPWIRIRLGTIDLGSSEQPVEVAAGVLASRNPMLARSSSLSTWERTAHGHVTDGLYRVIPGYFLGSNGREIASGGNSIESPDGTALRTSKIVVMLDAGPLIGGRRLVYLEGTGMSGLRGLLDDFAPGDIVAPATTAQEQLLRRTGAMVLPHGRQSTVRASVVEVRTMSGE